jgi:hypothetical protein
VGAFLGVQGGQGTVLKSPTSQRRVRTEDAVARVWAMQWQRRLRPLVDAVLRTVRRASGARPTRHPQPLAQPAAVYPGDYAGPLHPVYAPEPDGQPDPGEIVWTWVPYEEDHTQGKDRPVLLVGHDGPWLLALQLTSKDHDGDAGWQRRNGRTWVDIGTGAWDRRRRPSEVRVDRVVRVDPAAIRREGAVLAADRFAEVARAAERR